MFNEFLFNETEYNSNRLSISLEPSIIYGSTDIDCIIRTSLPTTLSAITSGKTRIPRAVLYKTPGMLVNIDGTTDVSASLSNTVTMGMSIINGYTTTKYHKSFFGTTIVGFTNINASAIQEHALKSNIVGKSRVNYAILTGEFTLTGTDISGSSIIDSDIQRFANLDATSSWQTSFSANLGDFILLNATVDASTNVSAVPSVEWALAATATSSSLNSTVLSKLSVSYRSIGQLLSEGSSDVRFPVLFDTTSYTYDSSSIDAIAHVEGSSTVTVGELNVPDLGVFLGPRRQVSYVFEVNKPRTNLLKLDAHYRLINFFESLLHAPDTLDYVRRMSQEELNAFDLDNPNITKWSSNDDLIGIKRGDRGVVSENAEGIFEGKDGQLAIYIGLDTT